MNHSLTKINFLEKCWPKKFSLPLIIITSFMPRPFWIIGVLVLLAIWILEPRKNFNFKALKSGLLVSSILIGSILGIHGLEDFWIYFQSDSLVLVLCFAILFTLRQETASFKVSKVEVTIILCVTSTGLLQFFGVLDTSQFAASQIIWGAPVIRSTGFLPHPTAYALALFFLQSINLKAEDYRGKRVLDFLIILTVATTQVRSIFLLSLIQSGSHLLIPILRQNSEKLIGFACGAVALIIFSFVFSPDIKRFLPERYAESLNFSGSHGQRAREYHLAKEIISSNPLGLGAKDIDQKVLAVRKASDIKNEPWLFDEWRGIHNAYLHQGVHWGIAGIGLVLFTFFFPSLIYIFSVKNSFDFQSLIFVLALAIYALTDSPFYLEIAPLLIIALCSFNYVAENNSGVNVWTNAIILIAAFGLGIILPKLRIKQIESSKVVSLTIDNPKDYKLQVRHNGGSLIVPRGKYVVIHFTPGPSRLNIDTPDEKYEIVFDFKVRFESYPRDMYFITSDKSANYSIVTFRRDAGILKLEKISYLPDQVFEVEGLPEILVGSGVEFMEEIPADYKYKKSVANPYLIRESDTLKTQYFCWEPALGIRNSRYGCKSDNFNYGPKVFKRIFRLI